ncbi:MAG TPA: flagellar basal-body rod protein FlgF [Burkholderiales bacterium]|nr:flagellar basal-body rod protein FlgF [Burkholderiales bacterium]
MDRMIYIAMTGAAHMAERQATIAHNLANASTTGYRADISAFRAAYVNGAGLTTRAFVVDSTAGADLTPGPIQETGRNLDVAVAGDGWIAVQMEDGSEAYTRDGSLQVDASGLLQTHDGRNVLGDGGPITLPQDTQAVIGRDGTVSAVPNGNQPNTVSTVGRIKLVNPEPAQLTKGSDGLFHLAGGEPAEADAGVSLVTGALEGSNVNVVSAMVDMIESARQYEMNMSLLQNADQNERAAAQTLLINS